MLIRRRYRLRVSSRESALNRITHIKVCNKGPIYLFQNLLQSSHEVRGIPEDSWPTGSRNESYDSYTNALDSKP